MIDPFVFLALHVSIQKSNKYIVEQLDVRRNKINELNILKLWDNR